MAVPTIYTYIRVYYIICSEEKRFIVTAAADPARLHPTLYAYICVTRIGVYIIIRSKYDGGDEFSGKNIRGKNETKQLYIIIIIYQQSYTLYYIIHNVSETSMYITSPKTYRVARA